MERRNANAERRTPNSELELRTMSSTEYDLEERLLDFAARIIRLAENVTRSPAGQHVALQVVRSGTSPLANHGEAQAAESNADFIHKMKLCSKERRETQRWLRLIIRVPLVKRAQRVDSLVGETDELIRIFVSSIRTAQKRSAREELRTEVKSSAFGVRRSKFNVRSSAGRSAARP